MKLATTVPTATFVGMLGDEQPDAATASSAIVTPMTPAIRDRPIMVVLPRLIDESRPVVPTSRRRVH